MALLLSEGSDVRPHLMISCCLLATGCAASHPEPRPVPVAITPVEYEEAACSALVFDVPMDRGIAHPELARSGRLPSVFMGWDLPTTESYINATDAVSTELGDFHTQESVSIKSGTRVR
jgi:hypothetical protein